MLGEEGERGVRLEKRRVRCVNGGEDMPRDRLAKAEMKMSPMSA